MGPILTHPVPSPNCREFTVKDEMVATEETFNPIVVIEEAVSEPVLRVNVLILEGKAKIEVKEATVETN